LPLQVNPDPVALDILLDISDLDTQTGEVMENILAHEASNVRDFYSTPARPVRVGIEATGLMAWFLNLKEELGIECHVGHPAKIRAAEPTKAEIGSARCGLFLKLPRGNRFPLIWLPFREASTPEIQSGMEIPHPLRTYTVSLTPPARSAYAYWRCS